MESRVSRIDADNESPIDFVQIDGLVRISLDFKFYYTESDLVYIGSICWLGLKMFNFSLFINKRKKQFSFHFFQRLMKGIPVLHEFQ